MDRDMVWRMSCALGKAVDLYTEINMSNGRYRLIDFKKSEVYGISDEGDYREAFEYMMQHGVNEEDAQGLREVFSLEKLQEAFCDKDIHNVSIRYRMKDVEPVLWMESTAIFLRELEPAYVCVIAKDVTRDVHYEDVKAENIRKSEHEEQLRRQQERLRSLMEGTDTIIYEYDIQKDIMSFAGNVPHTREKVEYTVENYIREFENYHTIYKEDKEEFLKKFKELIEKGGKRQIRYRADYFSRGYRWYKATIIRGEDVFGMPEKIIGRVDDIHSEMVTENQLRKRMEIDELTGVLNKATVTERVHNILDNFKRGQLGALFIFDIDDFKLVNDTLGHFFGDFLLQTIAAEIAGHFREKDIVGRIGGDEFMAYMGEVRSLESIEEKADKILEACRNIDVPEIQSVKCSIGIATVSDAGISYKSLFKRADAALYVAKQKGKNCYALYDPAVEKEILNLDRAVLRREPADVVGIEQNLSKYIFEMLYKAVDTEKVISSMLQFIGEYVNVSRVYIFELETENSLCVNTFEWCMEGIESKVGVHKNVSLKEMDGNYLDNFNEDGMFYCRDVAALPTMQREMCEAQGIKSMLQCVILDGGKIRGFVGLDECRKHRLWTNVQIDMIQFASQVLSTFLLKKRGQDEIEETSRSMYELLDKANSFIYIVEPSTYQILYANKQLEMVLGKDNPNRPCFEEMFGMDHPCENCPIKAYLEEGKVCSVRVYNPTYDSWYETEAKPIVWKKEEKIMVQSKDITDLVKEIEALKADRKEHGNK